MSISVGDAVLKLGVDTKDLDKGMKGIGNTIKSHQKAIGLGMVAAGGAILAAGALSIKTFAEMGDEVQKMALKTGFSTEALSELRHVAELSGTSIEGVEKGFKRMSALMLDASQGLGTATDALALLGLEVEDLDGLEPEAVFMELLEAIAAIEDPILRAAAAQEIFGKAGVDLLPMLSNGVEGLAAMRQEAHDLGIVFDQEAANKAAEFSDAMHRVGEATSGVKMAIAEQLIPVLIPLIDKVKNIISGISAWMKEHPGLTKVIVLGTVALGVLLTTLGGLLLIMPGIIALTGAFGITLSAAIWPVTLIVAAIAGLIAIGILLWKNWDTIKEKSVQIWNSIIGYFNQVWASIQKIFYGIRDSMWTPIKQAVDWIVSYVQRIIDTIAGLWNWVLRLTGRGGGVSVGEDSARGLSQAALDRMSELGLAEGGIAMRPITARIAENKPEAVIPLDRLNSTLGQGQMMTIIYEVDGRQMAKTVMPYAVSEIRLKQGAHI